MPVELRCRCGRRIRAADDLAGRPGKCPACGHVFILPQPTADATPELDELDDDATYSLQKPAGDNDAWAADVAVGPVVADTAGHQSETAAGTASSPVAKSSPVRKKRRKTKPKPPRPPAPPPKTLREAWKRSFRLPLEGEGSWTLLTWTLVYGLSHGLIKAAPLLLLTSFLSPLAFLVLAVLIPAMILFVGYLLFYLLQVLRAAAHGEDELPSTNAGTGIAADLAKWGVCLAAGFGLLVVYAVHGWWTGAELKPAAIAMCLAVGMLYTPMALLACALQDSTLAANPLTVLVAVARIPLQYLATCLLITLIVAAELLLEWLLPSIPLLTPLLQWGVALYASLVVMNMLGSLYFLNRNRIGWFRPGYDEPPAAPP